MRSLRIGLLSLCVALCFMMGCTVSKETVDQHPSCPEGCSCHMNSNGSAEVTCEGGGDLLLD
jgi:hypothetical protein